jgi:hypothetical protein
MMMYHIPKHLNLQQLCREVLKFCTHLLCLETVLHGQTWLYSTFLVRWDRRTDTSYVEILCKTNGYTFVISVGE